MASIRRVVWDDVLQAFAELPKVERIFHIFWLIGPIFLLAERTPADIWLSVLGLSFAIRMILRHDGRWLSHFWVRAGFLFWAACVVSSLLSPMPLYSVGEAIAWFRFPLFAMAVVFWLGRDMRMTHAMLASCFVGMVIMCGILMAEIIVVGSQSGRLSWPYGDLVPGSYLAKASLPALLITMAFSMVAKGRFFLLAGAVTILCLVMVLMTGERINFLIAFCGVTLAGLSWCRDLRRFLTIYAALFLLCGVQVYFLPEIVNRFGDDFVSNLPTQADSNYFSAMVPGIVAFQDSMIFGIGPGNFRELCVDIIRDTPNLDCHPHPHNFYIQLAGETGVVGLLTGVLFLGSIIWACAVPAFRNRSNVVVATMWIVPFGLFWPIASTADFFGQWNNIFMWSAVALALAGARIGSADDRSHNAA